MSRPVIADEDEKAYFSTQYLCDWVRETGYAGIEYPSAMGSGFNVVLFDAQAAEAVDLKYSHILHISHSSVELRDCEPVYDEGPYDYLLKP